MALKSLSQMSNRTFLIGILGLAILVGVGAILLGKSDEGVIDVSATIIDSNQKARETGGQVAPERPKSVDSSLPNGGLVGTGKSTQETPPAEVEGVATTSETSASSTEESGGSD